MNSFSDRWTWNNLEVEMYGCANGLMSLIRILEEVDFGDESVLPWAIKHLNELAEGDTISKMEEMEGLIGKFIGKSEFRRAEDSSPGDGTGLITHIRFKPSEWLVEEIKKDCFKQDSFFVVDLRNKGASSPGKEVTEAPGADPARSTMKENVAELKREGKQESIQ